MSSRTGELGLVRGEMIGEVVRGEGRREKQRDSLILILFFFFLYFF